MNHFQLTFPTSNSENEEETQKLGSSCLYYESYVCNLWYIPVSPRKILSRILDIQVQSDKLLLSRKVRHVLLRHAETLRCAVHSLPEGAGEVSLVIDCSIGTQLTKLFATKANVIDLTSSLNVSIVPTQLLHEKENYLNIGFYPPFSFPSQVKDV